MLDGFLDKKTKLTIAIIECAFDHTNVFGHGILVYLFLIMKVL